MKANCYEPSGYSNKKLYFFIVICVLVVLTILLLRIISIKKPTYRKSLKTTEISESTLSEGKSLYLFEFDFHLKVVFYIQ